MTLYIIAIIIYKYNKYNVSQITILNLHLVFSPPPSTPTLLRTPLQAADEAGWVAEHLPATLWQRVDLYQYHLGLKVHGLIVFHNLIQNNKLKCC